jgi:hypothetical protein
MKKLLLLALVLMLSILATAQEKISEGVLVSKQTMSSENEQINAQMQAMGETSSITYFKGDKSRNETSSAMTGNMVMIMDAATQQMLMLMDRPGMGKTYMLQSINPADEDLKNVTVEKGDETKTVLGYTCSQYIIKLKQNGENVEMTMFTTDKISAISQNTTAMGGKVEGFPLYFVMKMNQMGATIEVKSEVTEIKKESVSDDKLSLTPPEGYTKMGGM